MPVFATPLLSLWGRLRIYPLEQREGSHDASTLAHAYGGIRRRLLRPVWDLFGDVREFEQFTLLHVGLLAETKRKSLPRIAKTVQADAQALHHVLSKAHWSTTAMRARRLEVLRQALGETPFILCIDETGDRKKGHTTDYVAHQYIGNVTPWPTGSSRSTPTGYSTG